MSRFAKKTTSTKGPLTDDSYKYGFSFPTDKYSKIFKPGLSEQIVKEISHIKEEPVWMLNLRLKALKQFEAKQMPNWGADLSGINFDKIHYYLRPSDKQEKNWDDVPEEVKKTFDRLGIPEAEKKLLAGVKAQYDSEVVYGSLRKKLAKDGVLFMSMDEGLKNHPDLVKEYFDKVIKSGDNKFSALNTAVWSGGSFIYVPKGVKVDLPLQTYFRINSSNAGQFERTLIIVDEGASVHYVEGCFTSDTEILTNEGLIQIKNIVKNDKVLTHKGDYKSVYHTQVRPYTGNLFKISMTGDPNQSISATEEHPFLIVKRKYKNERNKTWNKSWTSVKDIKVGDYLCMPIINRVHKNDYLNEELPYGRTKARPKIANLKIKVSKELFRLIGYYLAEGSVSSGYYLNFSFGSHEREFIDDTKKIIQKVFGNVSVRESVHKKNNGISVVLSSAIICRFFQQFGLSSKTKKIPEWVMIEELERQKELINGWFRGDGNYYKKQLKHGLKEVFRICTTSKTLAYQGRQLLARLNIASSINVRNREFENRLTMYTLIIGGDYLSNFGKVVGIEIKTKLNGKKRATYYHVDKDYLYLPVKKIKTVKVEDFPVYNFSVKEDESYVAGGVAVHNCTAPNFSENSLHAAVVEIYVKKGARCQYTTIQNWYKNVYNLVTKRAWVGEEAEMIWTDFNMGSKVTMKYPGFILAEKGARGETLSMALASQGQHQDTGSKAIHLAPHTSSTIISKSISKDGGRTSYRGLVNVGPLASNSKNTVVCDALLLDELSRSDTYPLDQVFNSKVEVQHEATVSKIGDDQLFYLMSRGIDEESARKMVVNGFIADLVRKLPLEYAVEMNRLIDYEMEGSIG